MEYQDSITQRLLQQSTSHKKKRVVEHDINGWLETNKKEPKPKTKALFRPAIRRQSVPTRPDTPAVLDAHHSIETSQHALIIQHLKTKVQNTACSDEEGKPTPEERQKTHYYNDEDMKIKPFNSGYILKEKRRMKMQSKTLKRYQTPSLGLKPNAQSEQLRPVQPRRGTSLRRMVEIKSARFIATLKQIQ